MQSEDESKAPKRHGESLFDKDAKKAKKDAPPKKTNGPSKSKEDTKSPALPPGAKPASPAALPSAQDHSNSLVSALDFLNKYSQSTQAPPPVPQTLPGPSSVHQVVPTSSTAPSQVYVNPAPQVTPSPPQAPNQAPAVDPIPILQQLLPLLTTIANHLTQPAHLPQPQVPVPPLAPVAPVPAPASLILPPAAPPSQPDLASLLAGLTPQPPVQPAVDASASQGQFPASIFPISGPMKVLSPGEHLPDHLKEKIRSNKYVDFYEICHPDKSNYELGVTLSGEAPCLKMAPSKNEPLSEKDWGKAFDDFMGLYLRYYPLCTQELIGYGKRIRELMAIGANWRLYDVNFRKEKERRPCSWDAWSPELYSKAVATSGFTDEAKDKAPSPNRKSKQFFRGLTPQSSSKNKLQPVPPGYCFSYNRAGQRCSAPNCPYMHKCPLCSERHPIFQHDRYDKKSAKPFSNRAADSSRKSADSNKAGSSH